MADLPPLPDGFALDAAAAPPLPALPPGFALDQTAHTSQQVQTPAPAPAAPAQPAQTDLQQRVNALPFYQRLPAEFVSGTLPGGRLNPYNLPAQAATALAHNPVSGSALQAVAQPIQGQIGLMNPNAGQAVQQGVQQAYGSPGGAAGVVGRAVGSAVNLPYTLTPLGRMLSAGAAAGNERIDVANRREAGQQISGSEELARSAGAGALDFTLNKAINQFGGKIFSQLDPAAAKTASDLVKQYAAKLGKDAVTNEVISHAAIAANNLIAGRPMTEGMGRNSVVDALVQTAGQVAVHEAGQASEGKPTFLSSMRQRASAPEAVPQNVPGVDAKVGEEQSAPQTGKEADNEPQHLPEHRQDAEKTEPQPHADSSGTGEHPAQLGGGPDLAAYVAKISGDQATAPLIGTLTEQHGKYTKALVPIEQLHGLGETSDQVVAGKAGGEQKNPAVTVPSGTGQEGHLDLIDGNHSVEALRQAGATHAQAYVPESMVGKNGIEAVEKPSGAARGEESIQPVPATAPEANKNILQEMREGKQKESRDMPGPVNDGKGGFRIMGAEKFSPAERTEWAKAQIDALKDQRKTLSKPAAANSGTAWGLKAAKSEKQQRLAEVRGKIAAWEQELASAKSTVNPDLVAANGPAAKLARQRGTARKGMVSLPTKDEMVGPGSIYHEEVKPQLSKLANVGTEMVSGLKHLFPVETGAGNEKAQSVFREQFNRTANEHFKTEDAFETSRKEFDKLPMDQQHDFQRDMYNEQPQATPALQKIADAMHADTNEGRKALESLGHDAAKDWSETHFNMLWVKDPAKAQQMLAQRGLSGNPNRPGRIEGKAGFLKARTEGDFDAKLQQGLVPKFDNPVEMFLATKAERGKYIAGVRGMEQMVASDLIKRVKDQQSVPAGWGEVPNGAKGPLNNILAKGQHAAKLKGDGPLVAPEGLNNILDNITKPSAIGNKAAFRLAMDVNNTMTQSLLGFSGFHLKKVSQELINMSAARAVDLHLAHQDGAGSVAAKGIVSPLKAVMSGGDIQKMMLDQLPAQTPQQARVIDAMKTQFKARPDKEYETQWGRKFQKALDQGGLQGMIRAGMHGPLALNEKLMQGGVFAFVQRAKLHMGHEMIGDYLRQNPNAPHEALVKEAGQISDHLDNVLGLMNRDNLFWNRTARDLATLTTLSVGWNYGSGRALAGGLVDLGHGIGTLKAGGKISDIDTRRISYLATTAALTALTGAATTYLATGHAPKRLRDYIYPPNGAKDREGHDIRLNTGFYTSDWYDFMHDPIGTMKNKASPLMHAAGDLLANRDYRGNKIYDSDEPWYKMAGEVAGYLAKSSTPISMQQLHDVIVGGGKGGPGLKLAGFAGVKIARRELSMSDAENEAHKILIGRQPVEGHNAEETAKSLTIRDLADERREHDPKAAADVQKALAAGKITGKDIRSIAKRAGEPVGLKGLLKSSELNVHDLMEKVWPKMTADERSENQWLVRGKVGRANLSVEEKQKYWDQVKSGVK